LPGFHYKNKLYKYKSPKAAFTLNDTSSICPPLLSRFTFQGQDYKTVLWSFGDGNTPHYKIQLIFIINMELLFPNFMQLAMEDV
jgi:hypothetical protein